MAADALPPFVDRLWANLVFALQWRHNGHSIFSNHQPHDCLLNHWFRCRSKKTSKLRVTGLCAGNSPGTGEFPAQMASKAKNVSIWWRHHGLCRINKSSWWPRNARIQGINIMNMVQFEYISLVHQAWYHCHPYFLLGQWIKKMHVYIVQSFKPMVDLHRRLLKISADSKLDIHVLIFWPGICFWSHSGYQINFR